MKGLVWLWKKATYRDQEDWTSGEYRMWQERAGQVTPWYDNRALPDANDVEQPQAGYADAHLRMVDPNWRPR